MKNVLISSIVLLALIHVFSPFGYSQDGPAEFNQPYTPQFGDFRIGLAPVLLGNTPDGLQFGGRIHLSAYVSRYISFDTDLCLARNYVHAGPGIIGIPVAMLFVNSFLAEAEDDDEGTEISRDGMVSFLFKVTCVLLSVEHISAHIPVYKDLGISPYVSFLRYRSQYAYSVEMPENRVPDQFCFATGISLEQNIGRFVLAPFIEYTIGYRDKVSGYIAGLDCSMRFSLTRELSFR